MKSKYPEKSLSLSNRMPFKIFNPFTNVIYKIFIPDTRTQAIESENARGARKNFFCFRISSVRVRMMICEIGFWVWEMAEISYELAQTHTSNLIN